MDELKQMVNQIVLNVLSDQTGRSITIENAATKETAPKEKKERKARKTRTPQAQGEPTETNRLVCPLCHKGTILRGKSAYGCSEYKNGCTFRMDYATYGSELTDEQLAEAIKKIQI